MRDLILFDDHCPFCQRAILFIIKRDKRRNFIFSGLSGQTAQSLKPLLNQSNSETMILVENYNTSRSKVIYRSQAVFKIFWKLGGIYKIIGWKFILPSFCFDWTYKLVAKNRKYLCKKNVPYKTELYKERFLP